MVIHFKRGTHVADSTGLKVDGIAKISNLEDGQQYKFWGMLESLKQEETLALQSAAKEYLRRLSVIWSSPLLDYHCVVASNQFAMPAMSYYNYVDSALANNRAEANRQRGPQNCCREQRQASLWFNIRVIPVT